MTDLTTAGLLGCIKPIRSFSEALAAYILSSEVHEGERHALCYRLYTWSTTCQRADIDQRLERAAA